MAEINSLLDAFDDDDDIENANSNKNGAEKIESTNNTAVDLEAEHRALKARLKLIERQMQQQTKIRNNNSGMHKKSKQDSNPRPCNIDFTKCTDKQAVGGRDAAQTSSVVHAGDTSSSEDEVLRHDVDDNVHLSTDGRRLKRTIRERDEQTANVKQLLSQPSSSSPTSKSILRAKATAAGAALEKWSSSKSNGSSSADVYDPFFSVRVRAPKVASSVFDTFCIGRTKVRIATIVKTPKSLPIGDSVTMGVIVGKSAEKTSTSGNAYVMWRVHDLCDCEVQSLRIMLFGKAKEKHWKLNVGSVVVLVNVQLMDGGGKAPNAQHQNSICVRLTNDAQVIELGQSADFAMCQSMCQSRQEKCGNFVNITQSPVCTAHLMQRTRKFASARGEMVANGGGTAAAVMGGARGKAAVPALTTIKTARAPLSSGVKTASLTLDQVRARSTTTHIPTVTASTDANAALLNRLQVNRFANLRQFSQEPSAGSRNFLLTLGAKGDEAHAPKSHSSLMSRNLSHAAIKNAAHAESTRQPVGNALDLLRSISKPEKMPISQSSISSPSADARLAKSPRKSVANSSASDFIDLNTPPKHEGARKMTQQPQTIDIQKLRALRILQQKGKTLTKTRRSPLKSSELRAVLREQKQSNTDLSEQSSSLAGRQPNSLNENNFAVNSQHSSNLAPNELKCSKLGKRRMTADEIRVLIESKSKHEHLVDENDRKREDQYFTSMQQREMVETRMSETMQMTDVRVVSCKICAYTWHGQSDLCKSAGHQVNWHRGTRRYFRCVDCRRRTIAYDTPLPTRACEQCKSTNYERVGMRDERRVKDATANTALKIRGDEVPFVNR